MDFREVGGLAGGGFRPQEKAASRAPDIFLVPFGAAAAPLVVVTPGGESRAESARTAVIGPAPPPPGDFDLAAIRPVRAQRSLTGEPWRFSTPRSRDAAISATLHLAVLAALLIWATPAVETAAPEPLTIEIVADMPAPAMREPQGEPAPPAAEPPPPTVAETSPPPVAEAPTPPVGATPPPPVADASPPPIVETPPTLPATPPVAETPHPTRAVEPPPPAPTPGPALRRVSKPPSPSKAQPPTEAAAAAPRPTKLASLPPRTAAPAAPAASSAELAAYPNEVLGRVAAQKRYPAAALERAPHGVAVVRFSISASGQLAGASLSQSAGDPLLDAEALATVRRASPFPPPPAGAPRNFSASLSYRVR